MCVWVCVCVWLGCGGPGVQVAGQLGDSPGRFLTRAHSQPDPSMLSSPLLWDTVFPLQLKEFLLLHLFPPVTVESLLKFRGSCHFKAAFLTVVLFL